MRVWCTPECNCCMLAGPNEPHHGSTSSSRSRDACLVHTRVQLLHVHRPKRTAPGFNLFKQVSGRVFGAHPSAIAACSPAQTNRSRVQPLQAGLGTRVWCTPECNCCMFTGPNEPHHGSTSSSRSRDACLVHTRVQLLHVHRPKRTAPGFNLFKQVSGRVFGAHPSATAACSPAQTNRTTVQPLQAGLGTRVWCTPECNCCMFTGPKRTAPGFNLFKQVSGRVFGAHPSAIAACSPAQTNRTRVQPLQAGLGTRVWSAFGATAAFSPAQTSSSRSRDACLVHTRVRLLHVHRPKRTAPGFHLFKEVSGRVFGAHPSAIAACSPAQTNRSRVPPLQGGLGTRVWSAFGAHLSATAAFSPAQTNRTKRENQL